MFFIFFFFNDTATTEIYTLSLHDALPISFADAVLSLQNCRRSLKSRVDHDLDHVGEDFHVHADFLMRSEEHTSELQSRVDLVCRLLLEKKKKRTKSNNK